MSVQPKHKQIFNKAFQMVWKNNSKILRRSCYFDTHVYLFYFLYLKKQDLVEHWAIKSCRNKFSFEKGRKLIVFFFFFCSITFFLKLNKASKEWLDQDFRNWKIEFLGPFLILIRSFWIEIRQAIVSDLIFFILKQTKECCIDIWIPSIWMPFHHFKSNLV